jgi:hypothetical protein
MIYRLRVTKGMKNMKTKDGHAVLDGPDCVLLAHCRGSFATSLICCTNS